MYIYIYIYMLFMFSSGTIYLGIWILKKIGNYIIEFVRIYFNAIICTVSVWCEFARSIPLQCLS
jgi:sensor histidine kinase YesM